jgi:hypothetical protein
VPITQQTFDSLAFPVAKVRYTGSGYAATIYRDRDRTFRTRSSYNHALGGGARGALPAALKVLERALADIGAGTTVADYVAIPGDFDAGSYVFTFVPLDIFNGAAE